jgi:hypothetical protein
VADWVGQFDTVFFDYDLWQGMRRPHAAQNYTFDNPLELSTDFCDYKLFVNAKPVENGENEFVWQALNACII